MEFTRKRKRANMEEEDDAIAKMNEGNIYTLNNHIYFSDNITPKSAFQLCKQLRILETALKMEAIATKVDPEIYLHLTTDGGCVSSAFSIIDCMNNLKIPVNTVIDGDVSSAGTIISIHGDKRYIGENAYVLVHELRSGCWGKLAYIDDTYKNCVKIQDHINRIYLTKTKISKKMLNNLLIKDIQFNAEESIKMGLADEIYKD
jgi:ATP-dependent protease ClpP protease subunit